MGLDEAKQEWLANALALKVAVGEERMSFPSAGSLLARRLQRTRRFDALVIPWITLRPAQVRGTSVKWDGVVRTIPLSADSDRKTGFFQFFRAQMPAPSLQVFVFAPDGRRLFEGIGGLDFADEVTVDAKARHADFHPRPDLFADPRNLREGIALAFDPFLPPLDEE
jgi:hypothetical protein